ncbi:MAG: bifunctional methionine sulfoxide reductase B/A protein [Bacteroidales bacterium]|nr:bifunctional methionine sulfoxide reductase B/A protein [Bacteroidales bacterium]
MTYNTLTAEEQRIILHKGTEAPYSGIYDKHYAEGYYLCKQCNAPLYASSDKFDSGCGWPAFDDEIAGAVKRVPDRDGRRTEIICAKCNGHLGHVFFGENLTEKNTRHCVNSVSMSFLPASETDTAIFAAGCFWGVEYYLNKSEGVISATSGYIGGHVENPSYQEVCTKTTGHAEAVMVVFDKRKTSFENLAKYFFEIHDFEQQNGQGPDIGPQYRSAIFYKDELQKTKAMEIIELLKEKHYNPSTTLEQATTFWKAENYHQDYYNVKGSLPYCHAFRRIF